MTRTTLRTLGAKQSRLSAVPFFKRADRSALDMLASIADEAQVEAGRVLITEGNRHNEVYIIESGTVAVDIEGRQVAELGAGDVTGELAFFVDTAATATVRSASDVELLVIPHSRFDQVLTDNPSLLRTVTRSLAERLRAADSKLT